MRHASARDLLAWLLGRRQRFRVLGPSMEPFLANGTTVLVRQQSPKPGDVVLTTAPTGNVRIVKRVDHITPDGRLYLRGDGEVSTDSRDFGAVDPTATLGVVVCTFP